MIKPDRRILRVLIALVIVTYALIGLQGVLERLDANGLPHQRTGAPHQVLATLTVGPETGSDTYQRDAFGDGWASGPDGCDTRTHVLVAESLAATTVEHCSVLVGRWVSVYDNVETTSPEGLDVDHLVPLAEAWSSGARDWTARQRRAFANDTDPAQPDALIAVTATSNRAKGDSDPAEWLPPGAELRCRYAAAWINQKAAWDLAVDPAEHQALTNILDACPAGGGGDHD